MKGGLILVEHIDVTLKNLSAGIERSYCTRSYALAVVETWINRDSPKPAKVRFFGDSKLDVLYERITEDKQPKDVLTHEHRHDSWWLVKGPGEFPADHPTFHKDWESFSEALADIKAVFTPNQES
jgi:hypothetical protein